MDELELMGELKLRRDAIRAWLRAQAPELTGRQAHLDDGSTEQGYWNHGYQSALDDIIRILSAHQAYDTAGRAIH